MKTPLVISLLILAACSSNRTPELAEFQKEKVCSAEALGRLKPENVDPKNYTKQEIRERMLTFHPVVQKCYEEDMLRTGSVKSFNMCFVSEFDKKGLVKFFEFSSQEKIMSPEFTNCLNELKKSNALRGLKSVTILQPFRLYPTKN
jgi:hypothetical protein